MPQWMGNRAKRRKLLKDAKKKNGLAKKTPWEILYFLKYFLNDQEAKALISELSPQQKQLISPNLLPNEYKKIRHIGKTYSYDDLLKEIQWYSKELALNAKYINEFIRLESDFENLFLLGEYADAFACIDKIEKEICVSEWSIEKKLLVAEYRSGFKKNKEQLSVIVSDENDTLTNILIKNISTRVEKNISNSKYEELANKFIALHTDESIKQYLKFKLLFFKNLNFKNKGFILNMDSNSTIIDKYRSFMLVVSLFLSEKDRDIKFDSQIAKIIGELSKSLSDKRLIKFLYSLGTHPSLTKDELTSQIISTLDYYTASSYSKSYASAYNIIIKFPECIEMYEIYIKSAINLKLEVTNIYSESSLANKIFFNIRNIFIKNNYTPNSLLNSLNIYSSIASFPYCYNYFALINNEISLHDLNFSYNRMSNLLTKYYNPILSNLFEDSKNGISYLNELSKIYEESECIKFWIFLNESIENFDRDKVSEWGRQSYRHCLYSIKILQFKKLYEESLEEYDNVILNEKYFIQNNITHNKEEILHSKLLSLLYLERYNEAIEIVASANIGNINFSNRLKYNVMLDEILSYKVNEINDNICTPIFLHQYQFSANLSNNDLWISYDNFLCSLGLDFPHELRDIKKDFDPSRLIYFLKYLCKQDIYYSSFNFDSQDDLDNERIEVCLFLAEIDIDNKDEYFVEISDISRSLLIRKGIKQIDESKIYVDVKGLKGALDKDLKESFYRSVNLSNVPIDQLEKLLETSGNVIIPYYGKNTENSAVDMSAENIKLASYSRFEIFVDMFDKIRDKFIASNEFGIDTYLSMRIRHGTLLGEIRSPFETEFLVTKKDSLSGSYLTNEYWLSKFQFSSALVEGEFNSIMSDFSHKIDVVCDELKNKWLQIKTEKKITDGLFDYSFPEMMLMTAFKNKYADIDDYEVFFNQVIDDLWEKTEINLANIRHYISDTIKNTILELLTELKNVLESRINKSQYVVLNELVRNITFCQNSINVEFDKISRWFQRTNNKAINDFDFQLPIDASLATMNRIYRNNFTVITEIKNGSTIIFDGEYFALFTDIIQILFHNIIIHSELDSNMLKIVLEIYEKHNMINISISNNVNSSIDLIAKNKKIFDTRELLDKSHDSDITRKEGGSGYLKIKKILKTDLLRKNISIAINDIGSDYMFHSSISFELDNLQKN